MKATKIRTVNAKRGPCSLKVAGDRYVMEGPSGCHSLDVRATDDARLTAHWQGFVANNGGRALTATEQWDAARALVVGPAFTSVAPTVRLGDWLFYDSGRPQNDRLVKVAHISARGRVYGCVLYRSGRWGSQRPVGSVRRS